MAVTLVEVGGRLRRLEHYLSMLEHGTILVSLRRSEEGCAENQASWTWERWESSDQARFAVVVRCAYVIPPLADVFPLLSFR